MPPSPPARSLPADRSNPGNGPCGCHVPGLTGRPVLTVTAPEMRDRAAVRHVSAHLHDVPGVVAVQIDLPSHTIRIEGDVDPETARSALRRAGYEVT